MSIFDVLFFGLINMLFTYICSVSMEDICISDCATTHTILRSQKYFLQLTNTTSQVWTILGTSNTIEGFGKSSFILPNETRIYIKMRYILVSQLETFWVLKIFVLMAFTLKLLVRMEKNIFSSPQLSQAIRRF